MTDLQNHEITRLKELLQHTSEFIAYFELAEGKMHEWQQTIEQTLRKQQEQFEQFDNCFQKELLKLQDLLNETGLTRIQHNAQKIFHQADLRLKSLQENSQQIANFIQSLQALSEQHIQIIHTHTENTLSRIDSHLAQYDANHFNRIANESCEHVRQTAQQATLKSKILLKTFQWRAALIALMITMFTVFTMGLYISDEFPWESHSRAINERNAGKMLIEAWPKLSYQEQLKILNKQYDNPNH